MDKVSDNLLTPRDVQRMLRVREIIEYIEIFYNRQRRQARLGYLSPAAYERQFYGMAMAA
jgi:putative transposase